MPMSVSVRHRRSKAAASVRKRPHGASRGAPAFLSARQLRTVTRCLQDPPRASGIAAQRWSVARIHRLLRKRFGVTLSARYALRQLREAGVRIQLKRAREPGLTARALAHLRRALRRPPRAAGLEGERWSRARIAALIERRFKRRFTPAHAGRIARRLRGRGLGQARDRRLTQAQARELRHALLPRDRRSRAAMRSLTRRQVAALIERRWGVRYHPQSIPGLLRRWRIPFVLAPTQIGDPRPTPEQLAQLASALEGAPAAVGIPAPRWEQRHIARFLAERFALRYPARGLYRRMARWGVSVPSRASSGGTCSLTEAQRRSLACALALPPTESGLTDPRWSRALVARFILERFGVRYEPLSIPHLLRQVGIRLRARPAAAASVVATDGAPHSDRPFPEWEASRLVGGSTAMSQKVCGVATDLKFSDGSN